MSKYTSTIDIFTCYYSVDFCIKKLLYLFSFFLLKICRWTSGDLAAKCVMASEILIMLKMFRVKKIFQNTWNLSSSLSIITPSKQALMVMHARKIPRLDDG